MYKKQEIPLIPHTTKVTCILSSFDEDEPWDKKYTYELWNEMIEYSFDWNRDFTCEDFLARCDGYNVFFYDENSTKHHVEVRK